MASNFSEPTHLLRKTWTKFLRLLIKYHLLTYEKKKKKHEQI